jgi:predicted small lipoprotein YifL
MLRANLESAVPVSHRSKTMAVAALCALAPALLLAGCGRKGALDPPPGGMILEQRQGLTPTTRRAGEPVPEFDDQGRPVAPTGPKRRIPPDLLLN